MLPAFEEPLPLGKTKPALAFLLSIQRQFNTN
jgi:hypothetical protein